MYVNNVFYEDKFFSIRFCLLSSKFRDFLTTLKIANYSKVESIVEIGSNIFFAEQVQLLQLQLLLLLQNLLVCL